MDPDAIRRECIISWNFAANMWMLVNFAAGATNLGTFDPIWRACYEAWNGLRPALRQKRRNRQ